ncbi:hypothetical protein GPECTOR_104g77 [Gonium pectorale]|uniref:Uncharacterized protein n=1 Tax=Gonium pectorale TaxID=33097 RepID=A0A150FZN1_GONPE|nr:hypothetical protein GPECTOR_104g77 [Gonium pectorale]|eukprot:KXZ43071.1 hypothetical protein GPECTOR_104g77 [Gonium pectorale]
MGRCHIPHHAQSRPGPGPGLRSGWSGGALRCSPGDVALRASLLHPPSGLGAFLTAPLAKQLSGQAAKVGLRYSSVSATAGAVLVPRTGRLEEVWAAGRLGSLTLGAQLGPAEELTRPPPPPSSSSPLPPPSSGAVAAAPGGADSTTAAAACPLPAPSGLGSGSGISTTSPLDLDLDFGSLGRMGVRSLLLAYAPLPRPGAPAPSFTASVEMRSDRSLTFSFFQHVAATRHVVNPFEEDEVVGITNYLDIGLQLTTAPAGGAAGCVPGTAAASLARRSSGGGGGGRKSGGGGAPAAGGGGSGALPASVNLAAAWQVNKNWLLKARVGSDSAAAAVGVRVWHAVSAYLTACVSLQYATGLPRYGAELVVENFGPLRYERGADDVASGRALLQRHEASPQDLDNFAGRGVLIRRSSSSDSPSGRQALSAEEEAEAARVAQLM